MNNWRGNQQYGGQGGGYQRGGQQQRGGNEQRDYKPNTGVLRPNNDKRGPNDPDFIGTGNIEIDGRQHVRFLSIWINQDQRTGEDRFRIAFNAPKTQQRGYNGQNQPSQGGFRQGSNQGQGGYRGGGYPQQNQPSQGGFQGNGGYEPRPDGAMSRARPIPPAHYVENGPYNNAPPPTEYPEGPDEPDWTEHGDRIPF